MPLFPTSYTRAWDETTPLNTIIAGWIGQWLRYKVIDIRERMQCAEFGMAENVTSASVSANYAIDMSLGNVFFLTMTADTTFTFTNPPPSGKMGSFLLMLAEDSTGGWTPTFPSSVKWPWNTALTMNETASTVTIYSFFTINNGTRYYGNMLGTAFPV